MATVIPACLAAANKRPILVTVFSSVILSPTTPEYKKYIHDGQTIITSPHKVYGPEQNDLVLQLRKNGVDQLILAGMSANLCVESHLRELLEQGFEVAVVKDAVAAAQVPEGDGYLAALINFRFIANAVWSTDEAVERLSR